MPQNQRKKKNEINNDVKNDTDTDTDTDDDDDVVHFLLLIHAAIER